MALYYETVVSYDIEDNKNRKKLFEALKDMSLKPIQKSVFWGRLKVAGINTLPHLFNEYCADGDKAFYTRSSLSKEILKQSFGYKKEDFDDQAYEYL
jgi:CRISPR-associated protein Cas2